MAARPPTTSTRTDNHRTVLVPAIGIALGAILGALAIAVDQVALPGTRILIVLFSSGAAWGGAAVALGALARSRPAAAGAGAVVVASAVVTYYVGYQLTEFRGSTWESLSRAALLWGAVGVPGGAIAGLLGWHARSADARRRSLAWGALTGLLLGQGLAWAWRYGVQPDVVFTSTLVLPIALLAWGVRRGGAATAVPAAAITAVVAAVAWSWIGRAI